MFQFVSDLANLHGEENLPPCSEEGVDLRNTLIPGVTCLEDIEYDYEYLDGEETGMYLIIFNVIVSKKPIPASRFLCLYFQDINL